MGRTLGRAIFFLGLSGAPLANAQPTTQSPAGSAEAERKDPQGVKGISPFWEAIRAGDGAYAAREFAKALASYRNAVAKEPQNAMGHYRIGAAHLAQGELKEARAAWETAQRFASSNPPLKGKILFVLADLAEREGEFVKAIQAWNAYQAHAQQHPKAQVHPASAADRKKRIEEWRSLLERYAVVRERIEKRLNEADEASKKAK